LSKPARTPKWMPTAGAPAGQVRRRRGSRRASVRAMDEPKSQDQDTPTPGRGADLLTIGLLVFFVSLVVVVAALLVLPTILG
jgi:hypothetical protein